MDGSSQSAWTTRVNGTGEILNVAPAEGCYYYYGIVPITIPTIIPPTSEIGPSSEETTKKRANAIYNLNKKAPRGKRISRFVDFSEIGGCRGEGLLVMFCQLRSLDVLAIIIIGRGMLRGPQVTLSAAFPTSSDVREKYAQPIRMSGPF